LTLPPFKGTPGIIPDASPYLRGATYARRTAPMTVRSTAKSPRGGGRCLSAAQRYKPLRWLCSKGSSGVTTPAGQTYRGSSPPLAEEKPLAAAVLVAMGGFFVVLEALLVVENTPSDTWYVAFTGLFLFVMALLVRHEPHHHVANGAMVLVVVFMSLFFGYGGFYVGALLAAAGGILAIAWAPRPITAPVQVRR